MFKTITRASDSFW